MESLQQLWEPSEEFVKGSNLYHFQQWLKNEKGLLLSDYEMIWQWSIDHTEDFWAYIAEYFKVKFHTPYTSVLKGKNMPNYEWFEGATLNYAEHIFSKKSGDNDTAIVFLNEVIKENGGKREVTWGELQSKVLKLQQYLIKSGVKEGDRVVGYLPNVPEASIAFLACCSIGAIWSCCSLDFGEETVIDRFSQIEPKVLITADGYRYNGKPYDRLSSVNEIIASILSIQNVVLLPYQNEDATLPNATLWQDVMEEHSEEKELTFSPLPFSHPIWILYSSGTTGKPKAITHSHGGVLLEHLKYLTFHNDVKQGEHFFWFTTTGWMMWNMVQASMLVGAVPVLFDGSPTYPSFDRLWKMAEELKLPHFGTSAPFLTACMKRGMKPGEDFDLSHLKSVSSTGAPLPPDVFEWVYDAIDKDIWLCSMSGGTDVCTAFVGGNPMLPVYKGAIQSRSLGAALFASDEEGKILTEAGLLGEMIITRPMPSMPIYFWNDHEKERYFNSYFDHFEGVWRHGDWVTIYEDGSLVIQGRSDAVLNRNGIRIGTAEIYNVLDQISEIEDALILNLEKPNGGDIMPLFVKLKDGENLSDDLKTKINKTLKVQCSPRHVPSMIILAPDIPYTLSGKKMEVPVKKILMKMKGSSLVNTGAMRNPESMDFYMDLDL